MTSSSIKLEILQDLPPSVVMSQYTLNGCPVPLGSIQYSPFFVALVVFLISLQDEPGSPGCDPFATLSETIKENNDT